jgi:hypothetical protein
MNDPLLLVLLVLGSYRAQRLVTADDWPGALWLRDALQDRAMAQGKPRRDGTPGGTWGYLLAFFTCHWCLGSLLAVVVTLAVDRWWQGLGFPALWASAVAAGVGLLGELIDA